MDLISTIGESAALGSAGVIFWGDSEDASSMVRETHLARQSCWGNGYFGFRPHLDIQTEYYSLSPKHRGFAPGP